MAIDFPSSPTNGQRFIANNALYVWNSASSAWVASPLDRALPFNYLVNPFMDNSAQLGVGGTTTGFYPVEQWFLSFTNDGAVTASRQSLRSPRGSGFRSRIVVNTADTALAAGQYIQFVQRMEGNRVAAFQWGTASAVPAVLRFGIKAPAGTYSVAINNNGSTRSYVANFTISAGQANTDTEQVIAIPGDTTGTWNKDNTMGIQLGFCFGAGTTFQTTVNTWSAGNFIGTAATSNGMATVNNTFEIFDTGFYLDLNNTGRAPVFETPRYRSVVVECARYCYRAAFATGLTGSTTAIGRVGTRHLTSMRAAPTPAIRSAAQFADGVGTITINAVTTNYGNTSYFEHDSTISTGTGVAGRGIIGKSGSSNDIEVSARM